MKKNTGILKLVGIIAFVALLGGIAYAMSNRESTESRTKAAPVCELAINLTPKTTTTPTKTPTLTPTKTPTLTNTPTPTPGKCSVSFDLPDTAICVKDPVTGMPATFTVHSLPSTGGPYFVQTDWYIVLPKLGPHHYVWTEPAIAGKKYTIYGDWPGIPNFPNYNGTVENHYGVNIVDKYGTPVSPNCSGGLDFYWTPYVVCK